MMKIKYNLQIQKQLQKLLLFVVIMTSPIFVIAIPSGLKVVGKTAAEPIPQLQGVSIEPQIGKPLDLNLPFKNEEGEVVTLQKYLRPGHPMILSPVYYKCRSLCDYHLAGLNDGLKQLDWNIGDKFDVVAFSFDPQETPALALSKKENYIKSYGRVGADKGWQFLTADASTINAITQQVGFKYKWDQELGEWLHPSAAIIISPDGIINRYLPGVYFEAKDIKLALNESVEGRLGTFVDKLVLFCFKYDEHKSKYSPYVLNIMKLGGGFMMLVLGVWLLSFWLKSRQQKKEGYSTQS